MPDSSSTVYVLLGSNIEPEKHLQLAVTALRAHCAVLAISSVYRSRAFGPVAQPDFLNVAVKVSTPLSPAEFKQRLLEIEARLGRDRAAQQSKYDPRALDIDILLWGDTAFSYGSKPWQVPDENITQYAAVAIPLAEIAPEVVHPEDGKTLAEIAARFAEDKTICRLALNIE